MTNLEPAIRRFIVQDIMFKKDESILGFEDSLLEEGIIDSTGIVQLITFLERKFSVSISKQELVPENFETIQSIANLVKMKM